MTVYHESKSTKKSSRSWTQDKKLSSNLERFRNVRAVQDTYSSNELVSHDQNDQQDEEGDVCTGIVDEVLEYNEAKCV